MYTSSSWRASLLLTHLSVVMLLPHLPTELANMSYERIRIRITLPHWSVGVRLTLPHWSVGVRLTLPHWSVGM